MMDDQGSIEKCLLDPTTADDHVKSANGSLRWQSAVQELKGEAGFVKKKQQQKDPNSEMVRMNRACIRRFVNVFFAFYRMLHLWDAKEDVDQLYSGMQGFDCGIRLHHIVAASDDFSRLSMHWDLMPAAKLNYMQDFSGFFNCISQVFFARGVSALWRLVIISFSAGGILSQPRVRAACTGAQARGGCGHWYCGINRRRQEDHSAPDIAPAPAAVS